ncbi:MAG TPA: CPBP family intramembrane glutamic endopeptidase [Arenimonas sp.]|nr:CPBP family intramembrane glutamic endopeptidase [Arenimonas sp.]
MYIPVFSNKKLIVVLWLLGMIGVLCVLPVIPQLLASQQQMPSLPIALLQFIAALQSGILILIAVLTGVFSAQRVQLGAPVIQAFIAKQPMVEKLAPQIIPALLGGILGGFAILLITNQFAASLPSEFLQATNNLKIPWYARLFYGGISEELLIRWGLMSFLVWASYRLFQKNAGDVNKIHYIIAIAISALLFGAGHLPAMLAVSPVINMPLIAYILIGNAAFGLIAGTLYWKYGLECAILAHMLAHVTMLACESLM